MLAEITNLLEAVTILIGTVVVSFVAIRYAHRIFGILERGDWAINVGKTKVSVGKFAEVVSEQINQLNAAQQMEVVGHDYESSSATMIEPMPASEHGATGLGPSQIRRVLWVTDVPEEFFLERFALENNDISIDVRRTTGDALLSLTRNKHGFDVIISDVSRMEKGTFVGHAWRAILEGARAQGSIVPLVVYDRPAHLEKELAEIGGSQNSKSVVKPDLMTSSTSMLFRYFRIKGNLL